MLDFVRQYYRLPDEFGNAELDGVLQEPQGFFALGDGTICYGSLTSGHVSPTADAAPVQDRELIRTGDHDLLLRFDPDQVAEALLFERYQGERGRNAIRQAVRAVYYGLRPLLGVRLRSRLQRASLSGWERIPFPGWPVDTTVDRLMRSLLSALLRIGRTDSVPFIWFWPRGHGGCVTMTHDVETAQGLSYCDALMDLDDEFGVKSSFQLIPEQRYDVSETRLSSITERGFEVNVHDLNHDGHLFDNEKVFARRVERINQYGRRYGAEGFRSGVLYRKQEWMRALDFSYDMSVPNVGHLDPQKGGCCTVFPYRNGPLVEIPVTTVQDYSLLHVLQDYSIRLWREQCGIILDRFGLVSFNVHPDYVTDERPRAVYRDLLGYIRGELVESRRAWVALPRQVARWWRLRSGLRIDRHGNDWVIEGEGSQDAMLARAYLDDGELRFEPERDN